MPGQIPAEIWLFRIVHISNIDYILNNGMFTGNHPQADPNYLNIGDPNLIDQRHNYTVKIIPPNGYLGEYIPFYFGTLSPMLFKIKTGYGVHQYAQEDIAYICCKLDNVINNCSEWCFTDGHAKATISEFYNNLANLNQVDWTIINERMWTNTDSDYDRMRRKQAEFLVKDHVPLGCIEGIAVYNERSKLNVEQIIQRLGINIPVKVKNNFYY